MFLLDATKPFDLKTMLLGEEEWGFLPEVLVRSAIMFLVAIISLRLIGKRGIMQGVFELVTIITLGSAAGDPMFYKKVGLLPAILVFVTIILMYKLTNYFVAKYTAVEHLVEGKHFRLIKENRFVIEKNTSEMGKDEIFSDLRMHGVSHLGQVDAAYIEPSGKMSLYFLPDEKVSYGLPVIPELFEEQLTEIMCEGIYSCCYCANTISLTPAKEHTCGICKNNKWVKSVNHKRVK